MKWLLSSKAWAVVIPADFLPTFLFLWTAYSTAEQMSCGKLQSMKKPLSRESHKHTRPGSSWQTVHGFWVNFTYIQRDQEMQNAHLACSWIWEITTGRYWWYVTVNEIRIIALSIILKYTCNFFLLCLPRLHYFLCLCWQDLTMRETKSCHSCSWFSYLKKLIATISMVFFSPFYFMCIDILLTCLCTTCMQYLRRPEESGP